MDVPRISKNSGKELEFLFWLKKNPGIGLSFLFGPGNFKF